MLYQETGQGGQSFLDRHPELKEIHSEKFPNHLFIIPDGNARWARNHGLPTWAGHMKGKEVTMDMFRKVYELRRYIRIVSVWGFSVNNFKRPRDEVDFLFDLFEITIGEFLPEAQKKGIRIVHLGNKDLIKDHSPRLYNQIVEAEEKTKSNGEQTACLAIAFQGEDQTVRMLNAVRSLYLPEDARVTLEIARRLRDGEGFIPPADLLIRTSGEKRTSDLGWLVGAETEPWVIDKPFPDFDEESLAESLQYFSTVERRFGGRLGQ